MRAVVTEFADAAVGSAIVSIIEKHGKDSAHQVAEFIRGLQLGKSAASRSGSWA